MTAAAQNIKRMVKLLTRKSPKEAALAIEKSRRSSFIEEFWGITIWTLLIFNQKSIWDESCLLET